MQVEAKLPISSMSANYLAQRMVTMTRDGRIDQRQQRILLLFLEINSEVDSTAAKLHLGISHST
jgi:hypothetical protein